MGFIYSTLIYEISSDIWAQPSEMSDVSDDFREHCMSIPNIEGSFHWQQQNQGTGLKYLTGAEIAYQPALAKQLQPLCGLQISFIWYKTYFQHSNINHTFISGIIQYQVHVP